MYVDFDSVGLPTVLKIAAPCVQELFHKHVPTGLSEHDAKCWLVVADFWHCNERPAQFQMTEQVFEYHFCLMAARAIGRAFTAPFPHMHPNAPLMRLKYV